MYPYPTLSVRRKKFPEAPLLPFPGSPQEPLRLQIAASKERWCKVHRRGVKKRHERTTGAVLPVTPTDGFDRRPAPCGGAAGAAGREPPDHGGHRGGAPARAGARGVLDLG